MVTSHYLNQQWPSLPPYVCVTRTQWVKICELLVFHKIPPEQPGLYSLVISFGYFPLPIWRYQHLILIAKIVFIGTNNDRKITCEQMLVNLLFIMLTFYCSSYALRHIQHGYIHWYICISITKICYKCVYIHFYTHIHSILIPWLLMAWFCE